jgi:type IV secretory pathway VirB10-like protein
MDDKIASREEARQLDIRARLLRRGESFTSVWRRADATGEMVRMVINRTGTEHARSQGTAGLEWMPTDLQTSLVRQVPDKKVAVTQPCEKPKAGSMLLVHLNLPEDTEKAESHAGQYRVAAGTYRPCAVESAASSDVQGYFKAMVNEHVYDTASRQHALIS